MLRCTWVAPSKEAHDGEEKPDTSRRTLPSDLSCSLTSPPAWLHQSKLLRLEPRKQSQGDLSRKGIY